MTGMVLLVVLLILVGLAISLPLTALLIRLGHRAGTLDTPGAAGHIKPELRAVPNIGGESALYITRQRNAFRSGERRHEQMSIIAAGLGDDDIADLAAWYSSIEFSVRVPE